MRKPRSQPAQPPVETPAEDVGDFSEVKGQEHVKRALEVAAAGGHHVLLIGPTGTGKTLLARRLPSILPALSPAEAAETNAIYAGVGLARPAPLAAPFRAPHHVSSPASILGDSNQGQIWYGEVSLAHHGVLYLDDLPLFRSAILQALPAMLDEGRVATSDPAVTLPAAVMLVGAMQPCPCGYFADSLHRCRCAPEDGARYVLAVPAGLWDRCDLEVEVSGVRYSDTVDERPRESTESIRGRVLRARERQRARFGDRAEGSINARMNLQETIEICRVSEGADALLRTAMTRCGLSARAYHRVLRLARTIADLDQGEDISTAHVAEAIQYRSLQYIRVGELRT